MENKKQIVFIEAYSTVVFYKIAEEFKKRGYETVLIRLLKPNSSAIDFYNPVYDRVIDFNLDYSRLKSRNIRILTTTLLKTIGNSLNSIIKIKKLKPHVVFGRAAPSLAVAIFRIIFRKYPFIYFPYDIRAHFYPTMEMAKEIGRLSNSEIRAERYCFEKSDGIMHKGRKDELMVLNGRMLGDNLKLPPDITFQPYCSDSFIVPINKNKLSRRDKEFHLVHVGSSGVAKKSMYDSMFEDAKPFIKQKIHFHVYTRSNTDYDEDKIISLFNEEHKDFPNFKYFHIHEAMGPKEIVKEISKYDLGIWQPFDPKGFPDYDVQFNFSIGNKFATYLEAGISYVYNPKSRFLQELNKKYGIDFPLTTEKGKYNIDKLSPRLKKINFKKIERKIILARKDFNMQNHFDELEQFIEKIARKKK